MTVTQFINRYVAGRYALYRRIHGCDLPGDIHDGPADIPEDADYMEVIEIKASFFYNQDDCEWLPYMAIICRRIKE